MEKSMMLERLINYYTDGNKAKFAAMIGVAPQNVSAWISRNTFDAELLYAKCVNVSAAWLLSGEGDMIITEGKQDADKTNNELLDLCKSLVDNYKQRDDVMGKLVSMVNQIGAV